MDCSCKKCSKCRFKKNSWKCIKRNQLKHRISRGTNHIDSRILMQEAVVCMMKKTIPMDTTETVADESIEERSSTSQAKLIREARLEFGTQISELYMKKIEKVKTLQSDENMKNFRSECQKAINIPINAISAVTSEHLSDKFERLHSLLSGNSVKTTNGYISVNDHPLGYDYCILQIAEKFVCQGDIAISSNPQMAFPIATVIVSLWMSFPEFGKLFLGQIFRESPLLVPCFIPQKRGQCLEEFLKLLGYRVVHGSIENRDVYLRRQAGIARLYSAVTITAGRCADGPQHPYGVENCWNWISNFISLPPLPDISATLMLEFLQNTSAVLLEKFGKQFSKLLIIIQREYIPKLSAIDEGGPMTRLEIIVDKILREGAISKPQGMLPANFW